MKISPLQLMDTGQFRVGRPFSRLEFQIRKIAEEVVAQDQAILLLQQLHSVLAFVCDIFLSIWCISFSEYGVISASHCESNSADYGSGE